MNRFKARIDALHARGLCVQCQRPTSYWRCLGCRRRSAEARNRREAARREAINAKARANYQRRQEQAAA